MDKERRCINPICRKLLIDEPDLICSRCKRQGWRVTKKIGKGALFVVMTVGPMLVGSKGTKNTKA